jgi:hypothetical protein
MKMKKKVCALSAVTVDMNTIEMVSLMSMPLFISLR